MLLGGLPRSCLKTNRKTDYKFDLDKFTNISGKTGIYVQYAYVRARKLIQDSNIDISTRNLVFSELDETDNNLLKSFLKFEYYFIQALRDHGLYHKIWQAYAALLPVKTVGVMGDNRTYEYLCLLRAITSEDGMTADYYEFKKSFMQNISNKIVNSIRGINRVVYDVTSKPPSTIELE